METTQEYNQKKDTQHSFPQIKDEPSQIVKTVSDLNQIKREKIIRAALDSYLRGCVIGNLIDYQIQKDQVIQEDTYQKIISGEKQIDPKEINCDITWHYLFFTEIYSLLEYDPILHKNQEPINFESNMKYLLVMMNTSNQQTCQKLKNIFPEGLGFPEKSTPGENSDKYIDSLKQWLANKKQLTENEQMLRANKDQIPHLKLTISKIIPLLFIYSKKSLKDPVKKVAEYIKKFSQSKDYTSLSFYYVFMNKLLKYYLKEHSIKKAIDKIKGLKDKKKKYLENKMTPTIEKFDKKIERLKKILKEPKFANIGEASKQPIKDEYTFQILGLKKKQEYSEFSSFIVDIIVQLIGFINVLDHDSIIIKMSKIIYQNSSIPALLLSLPTLAVFYPDKYSGGQDHYQYRINYPDCMLNYLNPEPWFSTQISNQVFTAFVNQYSEQFYKNPN